MYKFGSDCNKKIGIPSHQSFCVALPLFCVAISRPQLYGPSIFQGWVDKYPNGMDGMIVPECLRAKVAAGHLGRKTGRGFYVWDGDKPLHVAD